MSTILMTPRRDREAPATPAPPIHRGPFPALLGMVALYAVVQAWITPTHPDVSWLVYAAGEVLDGARLYVDVIEVNPPLIIALSMPAALLSRLGILSVAAASDLWTFAMIGGSLALSWRVAAYSLSPQARRIVIGSAAFVLLQFVGYEFGQREHLMFAFVLPHALASAGRASGHRLPWGTALCAGLLAGVGFAIKPHFVAALLAVELYLGSRRGFRVWRRPETLGILGVFVAYALAVLVLAPQYFAFAWNARELYEAYRSDTELFLRSWRAGLVVIAAFLAFRTTRARAPECTGIVDVLAILAIGLLFAVYAQGKGFHYHWYPALGAAVILAGLTLSTLWRRRLPSVAVATSSLSLVWFFGFGIVMPWNNSELRELVERHAPGGTLVTLSPYISSAFPLVTQTGSKWGLRYPTLWPIIAFYPLGVWTVDRYRPLVQMSQTERSFVHSVVTDLDRSRPDLLLVDRRAPTSRLRGFDYTVYLSADPRFPRILAEYYPLTETALYRIYRRRTADS